MTPIAGMRDSQGMIGETHVTTLVTPLLNWIAERIDRSLLTVPDFDD